ncbi:hypothetical protein TELCIR_17790 [Teladorsagia circumcincta]|uniref:Uncharacterized protein n=1 Tax=Teladorsagia circumcincta TaxID=45464 RepID=A0A2G9TRT8_TELCI|nr:hypothetical protein TELCIR_17790 [Teladorsagia circumcincta]
MVIIWCSDAPCRDGLKDSRRVQVKYKRIFDEVIDGVPKVATSVTFRNSKIEWVTVELKVGMMLRDQVDFRKLSRSGRPKYSSGGHAALNAAASSGCSPYSTSAAAAHASLPSTSNGAPAATQQTSQTSQEHWGDQSADGLVYICTDAFHCILDGPGCIGVKDPDELCGKVMCRTPVIVGNLSLKTGAREIVVEEGEMCSD